MKYECVLLAVKDMERVKHFYTDIFGLKIIENLGANVSFVGGISLQTAET